MYIHALHLGGVSSYDYSGMFWNGGMSLFRIVVEQSIELLHTINGTIFELERHHHRAFIFIDGFKCLYRTEEQRN